VQQVAVQLLWKNQEKIDNKREVDSMGHHSRFDCCNGRLLCRIVFWTMS